MKVLLTVWFFALTAALFCSSTYVFFGEKSKMFAFFVALIVLPSLFLATVIVELGRSKRRAIFAVIVMAASTAAAFLTHKPAEVLARSTFFEFREGDLQAFVTDVLAHPKIRELTTGRQFRYINGQQYALDPLPESGLLQVETGLAREGIDPAAYRDIIRKLDGLGFHHMEITDSFIALDIGGFLDNGYGFLVVLGGSDPPKRGEAILRDTVWTTERVGGSWYYYERT